MDNEQMEKPIRVGSRKSELALIQTKHVIARLQKQFPKKKFEIHTMSTIGDRVLNISLPKIGEKSLFTRDLEDALRTGGVDFVVHSLKDLPTALPTGMAIGAVLEREDARDALVLNENYKTLTIETLPKGSVIGTSSLRRTAQIRRQYPHLVVCDIRGNLNTRLAKLDAPGSKFAGIVLAQAGLVRMGWLNRVSQILEPTELLYAVGQGALAIECRSNDEEILVMLQSLMCLNTSCRILAERSFLKTLGGGCSAPVAVWSTLKGDINDPNGNSAPNLRLTGAVWSLDGTTEIRDEIQCSLEIETSKENTSEENTEVDEEESNDEPPRKRIRESYTKSPESRKRDSPPVINDDMEVDNLKSYNFIELIETHAQLAKKCPYLGAGQQTTNDNNGNHTCGGGVGGGDADNAKTSCPLKFEIGQDVMGQCPFVNNETKVTMAAAGSCTLTQNDTATQNASKNTKASCPLKIEIGQDVMGQCPFVNNETKVTLAAMDNCPLTAKNENDTISASTDITDHAKPSTSKCPFASMHNVQDKTEAKTLEKCPFLQKTVKMFDYADEEKPQSSSKMPILIEDVENLFCGMFRHECYDRELFEKSNLLGQQLAEELIKKGALDVMKCAQAEIHSKV